MDIMAQRIYSRRKELGLTMEELGKRIGVGKSTVNKWEKGTVSNIPRTTISKIAEALEVSPVWLLGMDAEPSFNGQRDAEILLKLHMLRPAEVDIIEATIDAMIKNH